MRDSGYGVLLFPGLIVGLAVGLFIGQPSAGAVIGLGAAYTGYVNRPVRRPAFWALNLFSLSLIFANPTMSAIAVPVVLFIVAWHMRPLLGAPGAPLGAVAG